MEELDDTCPICFEEINQDNSHILECNHKFHTNCIVKWFRNSHKNCPLCNDISLDTNMPWGVKLQTVAEIKKFGRRKICPENIKKQLDKIKKLQDEQKDCRKKFFDFRNDNKDIIKKYNNLRSKTYTFNRRIRLAEYRLLALVQLNPIYIK